MKRMAVLLCTLALGATVLLGQNQATRHEVKYSVMIDPYRAEFNFDIPIAKDGELLPGLIIDLKKIEGIDDVRTSSFNSRYGIVIEKAELFDWEQIKPQVIDVVKKRVASKSNFIEVKSKKQPQP